MSIQARRVAVVGGGYAGMAAAVELAAQSIKVTVFEAGQVLGGRARRVDYRGTALDNGLHILLGAYSETLRLIALVHPSPDALFKRLPLQWHIHRELELKAARVAAPWHLVIALLGAKGLRIKERLAAVSFIRALRGLRFRLDRDTSVELLLKQHRQPENLCRLLWRPLALAALNTPVERASAQVFVNVLRDTFNGSRGASDLLLSRVDLSALFPESAAEFVARHGGEVRRATRVTAIDQADGGFLVEAAGVREWFSHVVCAVAPHQVNALLIGITALAAAADTIANLEYEPIYSVWLQYPHSVQLPAPMLGFAEGPIHWLFDRETLCGQHGLIGGVISASGTHQQATQADLAYVVQRELTRQLGAMPEPLWHRVIAEKRATFSCTPGIERPAQKTQLGNFYLAGDYTQSEYPGTIESAVRSGIQCAHEIRGAGV